LAEELPLKTCPFCPPNLDKTEVILANETCLFLQQPEPVLIGSGMIIPKRHRETLFDLTEDEWQDSLALLRDVKALLDQYYAPDGYNVGWNCGQVGGQHVFHAHMHVIPRYQDEPFAGKGIRHWLKQEVNKRPDSGDY
jgi:diadenosine tetraphosphate (Ap4A) HIT family hydrolase